MGYQNCGGSFEAVPEISGGKNLTSQTPVAPYCVPGRQATVDCHLAIGNAKEASRTKFCNESGTAYSPVAACVLESCLANFEVSGNSCVHMITNPYPLCQSTTVDQISCVDQVDFATIAERDRTCNQDEQSYTVGECIIKSCEKPDYELDTINNLCVKIKTPICNANETDSISCINDVTGAAVATRTRTCNQDEQSYTMGTVCNIQSCNSGLPPVDNVCIPPNNSGGNTGSGITYYVDVTAPNDNGSGSIDSPKKRIKSAIDLMSTSGGDTVIIKPGVYNHTLDAIIAPVSGTASDYNLIKAEVDGTVIISGVRDHSDFSYYSNLNLSISDYGVKNLEAPKYIQFEGLHFSSRTGSKSVSGQYIKFLRTSFEKGPNGNAYVLSIGGSYLLFEDCFFYGEGGRQAFGLYEGDHVILRRAVIRHDHGWRDTGKMEPQGVATIYNSNFVEFQNVILLDSSSDPNSGGSNWWYGGVTMATNGVNNQNNNIRGLIQLNVEGTFSIAGGSGNVNNIQMDDVAAAWTDQSIYKNKGSLINMDDGATKSVSVNRATVHGADAMAYLNYSGIYTLNMKNSVASNLSGSAFFNGNQTLNEAYNNCYETPSTQYYTNCQGTGATFYDPFLNGLKYLPRIEPGSELSTAGEDGGQVGAQITKKIGVSGTLYGEPGYKDRLNESLWPWPHQDRIKQEMCTDMGVTRGFCATGNGLYGGPVNLTSYIWEALGSSCPSEFCTP